MNKEPTALIFDFHRGTTHDGPGMRTTAFFKGCPLHCAWCHNPESIAPHAQLQWSPRPCIGCGTCINTCPQKALSLSSQGISIAHNLCQHCFACVEECPTGALEQLGKTWTMNTLCKEVCKDKMFFDSFEGGITISGGEPMMQTQAVATLLAMIKGQKIHTALDTCGVATQQQYAQVFPLVDTFLYDLKLFDSELHRQFTGSGNERILDNFQWLSSQIASHPEKQLWVRTPLIPGATDTAENLHALGAYLAQHPAVSRWELCAFNNVCRDKYEKLGLSWTYADTPLLADCHAKSCLSIAQQYVGSRAVLSGLTSKD